MGAITKSWGGNKEDEDGSKACHFKSVNICEFSIRIRAQVTYIGIRNIDTDYTLKQITLSLTESFRRSGKFPLLFICIAGVTKALHTHIVTLLITS